MTLLQCRTQQLIPTAYHLCNDLKPGPTFIYPFPSITLIPPTLIYNDTLPWTNTDISWTLLFHKQDNTSPLDMSSTQTSSSSTAYAVHMSDLNYPTVLVGFPQYIPLFSFLPTLLLYPHYLKTLSSPIPHWTILLFNLTMQCTSQTAHLPVTASVDLELAILHVTRSDDKSTQSPRPLLSSMTPRPPVGL
jgi:hypothetical protein